MSAPAWGEAEHLGFIKRRPPSDALARLVATIEPGGSVGAVRRLKGGIATATHRLDIVGPGGDTRSVVIRRFPTASRWFSVKGIEAEATTLELLATTPVPAPEVVLIDIDASILDAPALVLSLLPGRGLPVTSEPFFVRGMAEAMAAVHLQRAAHAPSDWMTPWRQKAPEGIPPLMAEVWEAMVGCAPVLEAAPQVLTHHDLHPGNTLWHRRRLTGVVDWGAASWGSALEDLAYCRLDLALQLGLDAADDLSDAYALASGADLRELPAWDLVASTRAIGVTQQWMLGYHDLGARHLTVEHLDANLDAFVRRAIASV
ncbi:MAG TPA: phosphotransferase [Acidimicrobiales bacterium]|nr:phosphotransferase [Acidimicrobiales bacterium]